MGCTNSKVSDVQSIDHVNKVSSEFENQYTVTKKHQEEANNTIPTIQTIHVKPFEKEIESEEANSTLKSTIRFWVEDSDETKYNVNEWKQLIDKLTKDKNLNDYCLSKGIANFNDLNELAQFLKDSPAKNETEKAWSVYIWIAKNIEYDFELFKKGSYQNENDPENVIKSGKCVCEGYAQLYQRLCQKLDLECVRIGGYSKAFSHKIGQIPKNDHAWNAVKIDDKWQYVESTWAAGYLKNNSFTKQFQPYYFATPPQIFIESHYFQPFQLQKKKITLEEFVRLPMNKLSFHLNGLKCLNFNTSEINTNKNPFFIEYSSPKETLLLAELLDETNGEKIKNAIFIQRDLDLKYALIVFVPEVTKSYILELYARNSNNKSENTYTLASQYLIRKTSDANESYLPEYNMVFDPYDIKCLSHESLVVNEKRNPCLIEFDVPDKVLLIAELYDEYNSEISDCILIQRDAKTNKHGVFVLLQKVGPYKLKLFAKYKNETGSTYQQFGEFRIFSQTAKLENFLFPKYEIYFKEYELMCLSHCSQIVNAKENILTLEFDYPKSTQILAELKDMNKKALENRTFIQKNKNDKIEVKVSLANNQKRFFLNIFARHANSEKQTYYSLTEFWVLCHELTSNKPAIQFPIYYSPANINYTIYYPFELKLKVNRLYRFKFHIERVFDVALVDQNGSWTHLMLDLDEKDIWTIEKSFEINGKLDLFVQLPESPKFTPLFGYQLE
jgi:hypothetical protein